MSGLTSSQVITNLLVLGHGDIDEDLGGRVVDIDGLEDGGTIIGDGDLLARLLVTHRLKNLVHTLRSKSSLDQVTDCDSANERLLNRERTR